MTREHHWKTRLAIALAIGALVGCAEALADNESVDLASLEKEAAERINAHRKKSSLPPFAYDDKVAEIARRHSQRMADGKVLFGHDGFQTRVDKVSKIVELAGFAENVSKHQRESDFAKTAVEKWLKSPPHRKNIDGNYNLTGVGAARNEDGVVYFTQLFVRTR